MVVLSAFTRRSLEAASTAEDGDRGTNATKPLRGTSGGAYWAATRCAATRGAAYFGTGKDVYRATFKEIDGTSGDAGTTTGKDVASWATWGERQRRGANRLRNKSAKRRPKPGESPRK